MPLLDRNGWKPDEYRGDGSMVPFSEVEDAIAAAPASARIGVDLPNDAKPDALATIQDRLGLIAVAFPNFSDGRGFSLARALRQQGYRGVLRASGHLLPDQFPFAIACGFDEVEIDEERSMRQPIEQWLEALGSIEDSYQDVPGQTSIFARRAAAG